jgi:hypothetical protein
LASEKRERPWDVHAIDRFRNNLKEIGLGRDKIRDELQAIIEG